MIIRMSQPWRHPKTGILYFRSRLPADVAESLAGRTFTLDVAGGATTIRLNGWIKVSLRTKDLGEARLRHASVQAQIQSRWQAARNGTRSLTNRQVHEIAGDWYRDLVREHEDEPGDVEQWELFQDLLSGRNFLRPSVEEVRQPGATAPERFVRGSIALADWVGLELLVRPVVAPRSALDCIRTREQGRGDRQQDLLP